MIDADMKPTVDGKSFHLKAGKTGVLLLHGFTATTFEVRGLAERLHAAGYTVSAPLLPGHGAKPDDLNHVRWQDWVRTAEEALEQLKKECDPVFVGGESMGGLLALRLAEKNEDIHGLLLYAPAVINLKLILTPILKHFIKFSKKNNGDDLYEWQGYPVNPVAGAAELFSLQRQTVADLKSVRQRVIIFQGRNDHTVVPAGARYLFDRISSTEKQLIWYECGHCVLLENDFESAVGLSLKFLEQSFIRE